MGKKSPAEKKAAHSAFEARFAFNKKREATKDAIWAPEKLQAATVFLLDIDPQTAAEKSDLPLTALRNIANQRFAATPAQARGIMKAATYFEWQPS